jgi:hypothetical protein
MTKRKSTDNTMTKRKSTDNTMTKRKSTDNTMTKRKSTDNTMTKRKRKDNTMTKRKRTDNTMAQRKVQKDKQRSTKHTYKTKDRVTLTPLKTRGELRCSGKVSRYCPTRGTRRVNLVTTPVISHE